MKPQLLNIFFDNHLVQAICWTLVHSIWQGLLAALLAGAVILLTRRANPGLRYNLLTSLLLMMLVVAGVTFYIEYGSVSGVGNAAVAMGISDAGQSIPEFSWRALSAGGGSWTMMNRVISYFDQHAAIIVAVWFFVLSIRLLQMSANLISVQRIRRRKVHIPRERWIRQLNQLRETLQIRKTVSLLESEIAKVPLVIGFLKPVILMPFGLLSYLPPDQLEAILLHELAHIKRKDYFVNLCQSFAEVVFFFNPAVLWISAMIRTERENCCDHLAVTRTSDKKTYIKALMNFHDFRFSASEQPALAFPGEKDHDLLNRVRRIVFGSNKSLNVMEKAFLLLCFMATVSIPMVFSQPQRQTQARAPIVQAPAQSPAVMVKNDTLPPPYDHSFDLSKVPEGTTKKYTRVDNGVVKSSYLVKRKGVVYQLDKENNRIAELKVNGKTVAAKATETPEGTLASLKIMQLFNKDEAGAAYKDTYLARLNTLKEENPSISEKERVIVHNGVTPNSKIVTFMLKGLKIVEENGKITQLSYLNNRVPDAKIPEYSSYIQKMVDLAVARSAEEEKPVAEKKAMDDPASGATAVRMMMDDLVKENVVTGKNDISSIELTGEALVVNGKKQSESLHHVFADKYLKMVGCNIYYGNVNAPGRGLIMTSKDL